MRCDSLRKRKINCSKTTFKSFISLTFIHVALASFAERQQQFNSRRRTAPLSNFSIKSLHFMLSCIGLLILKSKFFAAKWKWSNGNESSINFEKRQRTKAKAILENSRNRSLHFFFIRLCEIAWHRHNGRWDGPLNWHFWLRDLFFVFEQFDDDWGARGVGMVRKTCRVIEHLRKHGTLNN